MEIIVEIKLVQVNFVPTTWKVDDRGHPVTARRTAVGQLAFDCELLPDEVQAQLREIIAREFAAQYGHLGR